MEALINFDQELIIYLNHYFSSFWDNFFWIFTSKTVWIPMYATLLGVIFKGQGKKGLVTVVAFSVLILLCDQISTNVFKEGFERLRPSHDPVLRNLVHIVNGKKGGPYGFVSSHATNSFGLAMLSSLLFRKKSFSLFIFSWALINSYSRVYLGLHYPGDILGGMLLGISLGWAVYNIYVLILPKFVLLMHSNKNLFKKEIAGHFSKTSVNYITFGGIIICLTILFAAKLFLKFL